MLIRTKKLGGKVRNLFLICSRSFSQLTKNKRQDKLTRKVIGDKNSYFSLHNTLSSSAHALANSPLVPKGFSLFIERENVPSKNNVDNN